MPQPFIRSAEPLLGKSVRRILPSISSALLALILLSAILNPPSSPAQGTPVMFPLQQMAGGVAYTETFTANAAQSWLTDGTNAYIGSSYTITPNGGTNPVILMTPNTYLIQFPDARYPWRIQVPNTTNVQNALSLSTGPLPTYLLPPGWPVWNNGSGTNENLSGSFTGAVTATGGNVLTNNYTGASIFAPMLTGEIGLENNPTNVVSIASAVDSYNSGYGTYTVFSAINPVSDAGPGFFSGENFQVLSTSGLQFGVWYSTNANAPFNQWNYFPTPPVEHSNGNGTSTYGVTLTQTNSTFYIFRQLSGPPEFVNTMQAAAGANSVKLGFTSDGNYQDLNLIYNGVTVAKWMFQGGGVSLNTTNGNNFLAGWTYGTTFGSGNGGASGAFIGTNGFANFLSITNTGYYFSATNASIHSGAPGKSIMSTIGGTNFWVIDKGGGIFTTNHVP